jgi:hypothetical protein
VLPSKKILVLGESHAFVFAHSSRFKTTFNNYDWDVLAVMGATISGLDNPNSKTKALPKFKEKLEDGYRDKVIVLLGEVDLGFVIWHRAEKYGGSPMDFCNQAIRNYQLFLKEVEQKTGEIIVISAPLPTIPDDAISGEVANLRKSIKATQFERTSLTKYFNQKMSELCIDFRYSFLNLDNLSTGDNGLVAPFLLNKDKTDHHYDKKEYLLLLIQGLREFL